jgi:membrane protease YdiL (CAAX protease family)
LLLPFLVLGFAYGTLWLSGRAAFVAPAHAGGLPSFAFDVLLSFVVVAVFGAFPEEIGWRGYLLPRLRGLGVRPALLLTGLLHGLWHLPIIVGTPLYHAAGDRLVVVPLFLLTLTLAGVCYGYLRLTTGSIWPGTIAHGAFNVFWDRFNACTAGASPEVVEYWAGESGVLTVAALVVVAGWLSYRLDRVGRGLSGGVLAGNPVERRIGG